MEFDDRDLMEESRDDLSRNTKREIGQWGGSVFIVPRQRASRHRIVWTGVDKKQRRLRQHGWKAKHTSAQAAAAAFGLQACAFQNLLESRRRRAK